eukprot:s1281_g3.t1
MILQAVLRKRVCRNAKHAISGDLTPESVELLHVISEPLKVELAYDMYSQVLMWHPFFLELLQENSPLMRPICHRAMSMLLLSSTDIIFNLGEEGTENKGNGGIEPEFSSGMQDQQCAAPALAKAGELWGDLLAAREAALQRRKGMLAVVEKHCSAEAEAQATAVAEMLLEAWRRFENTEASADEFVTRLHCAFPPGKGARPSRSLRRAARTRDPERRVAAQLAWLRMYPKVRTTCCAAPVCFKCKVRGWHQHITCEDDGFWAERQLQETGREAQHCPNCQVPTMRSDGCTQIRCVCGTEWNWQERDDPASMQVDDEDFEDDDDESDRLGSLGIWEDSLGVGPETVSVPSRTALELACMNPALQNQNIIELLLRAPGSNEKTQRRTPVEASLLPASGQRACENRKSKAVQAGDFGQCRAGHNLKPYNVLDRPSKDEPDEWVCDECQTEASKNSSLGQRPRFRCEACDYDLCLKCFVGESVYGPVKSKARGRELPEEEEEVQSHQQFYIGDDKDESTEMSTRYRPPGRSLGVRGRAVGGRKSRRRAKAYADKESDESDEEKAESSGKDPEPQLDSFWDSMDAFRDEGDVPEPSSSSSQRPEFREALKDMAGVLDHWRSDRQGEVSEAAEAAADTLRLGGQKPDVGWPTKLPSTPVPLHCAVRSGNRRSLETCLKWSPPTEVALQELIKLSFTERQPLEDHGGTALGVVLGSHVAHERQGRASLCPDLLWNGRGGGEPGLFGPG